MKLKQFVCKAASIAMCAIDYWNNCSFSEC